MDPSGFVQAMNATHAHVYSARPDAPVVVDPQRGRGRGDPFRRATAGVLRRIADRVEPRAVEACGTAAA